MRDERKILKEIINIWEKQDKIIKNIIFKIKDFNDNLYIHSINVGMYSLILSKEIYNNKTDIENIFMAGLLHDYGKLFISKSIIDKAGKLIDKEKEEIKKHTILGYKKLKELSIDEKILNAILDHHERIDKSGYMKKAENQISEYAKILMITDVYDAMTSDRIYRPKINKDIVIKYLIENAGKKLSKQNVFIFIDSIKKLNIDYINENIHKELDLNVLI